MKFHCTYDRNVKDYGVTIKIKRFICTSASCNHTEAILPDFLIHYKHYSALEIESVLLDAFEADSALDIDTKISLSTVRRWIGEFRPNLHETVSKLKMLVLKRSGFLVTELSFCTENSITAIQQLLAYLPSIYFSCFLGAASILLQSLAGST